MFPIPTLSPLLVRAGLLALGVALGMWALSTAEQLGYDRRNAELQTQELRQERGSTEQLLKNISDSAGADQQAAASIEKTNQAAAARAQTLGAHLSAQGSKPFNSPRKNHDHNSANPKQTAAPAAEPDPAIPLLGQSVLDRLTVRVLNDARANADAAPAEARGTSPGADAEGEATADAPTTITGADFADNDLEVVRLYPELATRHNGLVDWVNRQCAPEPEASPTNH